jgi:hypothetical protein
LKQQLNIQYTINFGNQRHEDYESCAGKVASILNHALKPKQRRTLRISLFTAQDMANSKITNNLLETRKLPLAI